MNRKIKHILAIALAVLMIVGAFGAFAVSAAAEVPEFAVYFQNEKNWGKVSAYTYFEKDIKDPVTNEVIRTEITEVKPFPGVALEKVGTTTLIDKVQYPDVTEHDIYEYNCEEYKKAMESGEYDRAFVIFNGGEEHAQQSSEIHLGKFFGGRHLVGLDNDNNATIAHFVSPEYINLFTENKKG